DDLALALVGALEPAVHDRTMSRRRTTGKRASTEAPIEAAAGAPANPIAAERGTRPAPSEIKPAPSESKPAPSDSKPAPSETKPAARANRPSPGAAKTASGEKKRRRRSTADFEASIGYRFKDPALLEQALTHISALTGVRNRAGSYQRLEFL